MSRAWNLTLLVPVESLPRHMPFDAKYHDIKENYVVYICRCQLPAGSRYFVEQLYFCLSCSITRCHVGRHSRNGLIMCSLVCL